MRCYRKLCCFRCQNDLYYALYEPYISLESFLSDCPLDNIKSQKNVGSMKRSMDGLSHFVKMCQKNGIALNLKTAKRSLERMRREREALNFAYDLRSFFLVREDMKQILTALLMLTNMPRIRI